MRSALLLLSFAAAACGRLGFDAVQDASPPRDTGVVLPRTELYLKASNTDANDLFGASASLSTNGHLLAIGAYQEASAATGVNGNQADNSVTGAGAVYLFTRGDTSWAQSAYLKASNPNINDQFGFTVSLSGDGHTLAVDAPLEASAATGINGAQADNTAAGAGAVYVFTDSGGAWTQQAYIKASNAGASDQFGYSLALSADGNTLVVGARQEDSDAMGIGANQANNTAMDSGAVYVFTRTGTTWSQQVYIKPTAVRAGNEFGRSVAISYDGNTIVAAATYDKSNATGVGGDDTNQIAQAAGAAYVFTRDASSVWSQQSYLKASNTNAGDSFGWNVSISGDASTIAIAAIEEASSATGVGANQLDNGAMSAGAVYVFKRASPWTQEAYIKAPNAETSDHFGWATALTPDGNELVISATAEASAATGIDSTQLADNSAVAAGAAYVYTRTAGQWTFASYLKATNTNSADDFGKSVAVSARGTIVIGASSEDSAATGIDGDASSNASSASGAAYLFE